MSYFMLFSIEIGHSIHNTIQGMLWAELMSQRRGLVAQLADEEILPGGKTRGKNMEKVRYMKYENQDLDSLIHELWISHSYPHTPSDTIF